MTQDYVITYSIYLDVWHQRKIIFETRYFLHKQWEKLYVILTCFDELLYISDKVVSVVVYPPHLQTLT